MTDLAPYVICRGAARAIDFYSQGLGASETMRLEEPSGKIGHAELALGDAILMLADEYPDHGVLAPPSIGGTPVRLHLYVDDVDAVVRRAVGAGATIARPVEDQFYGDRSGQIVDPFGHLWVLATRIERLSVAETQRRFGALVRG